MADHPVVVVSARRYYPTQTDRHTWAAQAAIEAEGRPAITRQLPDEASDATVTDALRAAAISVHRAHHEYPGVESLRWKEAHIQELERLAVARFGPHQVLISLGYEPMPAPSRPAGPRSMFNL